MEITIVVDNNSIPVAHYDECKKKQGVVAVVNSGSEKILYYGGFSDTIAYNMALLHIDPKEIDTVVLGQGVAEQIQGLVPVLIARAKRIPVYFKHNIFDAKPQMKNILTAHGADLKSVTTPVEIYPHLWVVEPTALEAATDEGEGLEMHIAGERGLIWIGGRTQCGIEKRIRFGLKATGAERLHGFVGGPGLSEKFDNKETLEAIKIFEPDFIASDYETVKILVASMGPSSMNRYLPIFCGMTISC